MVFAGLLAIGMGLVLGLLGGGGSVLTVPILVYAIGLDPKEAIATSLIAVSATAAVGAWLQSRAGHVQLRTAVVFGAASMVGAFAGGRLAAFVPGTWLLVFFGSLMVATSVAMLRGRKEPDAGTPRKSANWPILVADGLAVGAVTGLVGAGGGFLIVPALVMLVGMDMRSAIGTSLAIIAANASTAFLGHVGHTPVDWTLVGVVTSMAIVGMLGGAAVGKRLPQAALRRGFGVFILAMASYILHREGALDAVAGIVGPAGVAIAVLLGVTVGAGALARRLRLA